MSLRILLPLALAIGLIALLAGPGRETPGRSAQAAPAQQDVARAHGAGCAARARGRFIGLGGDESFANPSQRDCILGLQGASGAAVMRQVFDWRSIETVRGRYSWSAYDAWVTSVAKKRMRVLAILYRSPRFYARVPAHGTYPPRDMSAFARFAAAAVDRYGPRGSFWRAHPGVPKQPIRSWQIWNEPNLAVYWLPRPNVRGYAGMLRVVGTAIKRRDRGAEVVTAGIPATLLSGSIPFSRFVSGLYRAGAGRYFSTLAPNAYGVNARAVIGLIRRVRRLMNRSGGRGDRIWITELGWGTGGPRHRYNVGAKRQAREIRAAFEGLYRQRRALGLRGIVYFGWQDLPAYPPAYKDMWGLHTGLFTLSGQPKPGYGVFKRLAPKLR